MKRLAIFFLTLSVLLGIRIQSVVGNAIPTAIRNPQHDDTVRTFSVRPFDRIRITGPFVVTITGGNSFSVKASGPSPDLGAMDIGTQNGTLLVQYTPVKRSENQNIDHGVVTVSITLPILKKAEFTELARFSIKGFDEMDYLDLIASSMANGSADVKARNLKFTVDKLSSLVVQGESDRLKAYLQGKSSLKGYALKVRSVVITAEGMSRAEVYASETLDVTATGMSHVVYKGNPTTRMDTDSKSIIKAEPID